MDNRNLTTEYFRAIERWENEGGKASPPPRLMPGSQIETNRKDRSLKKRNNERKPVENKAA